MNGHRALPLRPLSRLSENFEEAGLEPGACRMRSGRSITDRCEVGRVTSSDFLEIFRNSCTGIVPNCAVQIKNCTERVEKLWTI